MTSCDHIIKGKPAWVYVAAVKPKSTFAACRSCGSAHEMFLICNVTS